MAIPSEVGDMAKAAVNQNTGATAGGDPNMWREGKCVACGGHENPAVVAAATAIMNQSGGGQTVERGSQGRG